MGRLDGNALYGDGGSIEPAVRLVRRGLRRVQSVEPRWRTKVAEELIRGFYFLLDGPHLIVAAGTVVHCLDRGTGAAVWSSSTHAQTTGVITDGTYVVFAFPDFVVCLDRARGSQQWERRCEAVPRALATVRSPLDKVFVGQDGAAVHALSKTDGTIIWRRQLDGEQSGVWSLLPIGTHLIAAHGDHACGGLLSCLDQTTGETIWRLETGGGGIGPPPVSFDGRVLLVRAASGSLILVRPEDGSVVRQEHLGLERAGTEFGTPVAANPVLLASPGVLSGQYELLAVDPDTLQKRWALHSPEPIGRPVVSDDVLYMTEKRSISAISARDGTRLWSYEYAHATSTTIVVGGGQLYAGGTIFDQSSPDGAHFVYAF